MTYRVVMPRSIPRDDADRVQREVWRRGYGTRAGGRDAKRPERRVVEFLQVLEELPEPSAVSGLERELDAVLSGGRVKAQSDGSGAWLETVQRPARRTRAG